LCAHELKRFLWQTSRKQQQKKNHRGKMNHANTKEEVIEAFAVFDKSGQGTIDKNEFRAVLEELGDMMESHEIEELLYEADLNGNGQIPYAQFVDMLFMWG
jgi:calmodulin